MTTSPTPGGGFTRASSGLVRQVGTRDVFFFGWQSTALSFIVFAVLAWGAYPGASMEFASLLAMVGGIAIAACYGLVGTLYPRSGAEYVFLSRTLHPAVGFALSFSFAFWMMFNLGISAALICVFAVSPLLAGIGVQEHSAVLLGLAKWLSEPAGMFLGGSAVVALVGYLHYRGAGSYFRWQRWASYLSLVSLAATVVVLVLAVTGVLDFQANFDRLAGPGSYQQVAAEGRAAGDVPFSFTATWNFALWPVVSLWFANQVVAFSGEVKDVRRGQLVGMVGSVIAAGIAFIVLMFLYRTAFGADFLLAAAGSGMPLNAPPQVPFFTAIAGGNLAITVLTGLWVVAITLFAAATTVAYPSRTMLAWSLDGMGPRRLADVNDRHHSPHWIILACVAVAETALGLFAFTHLLGIVSGYVGFMVNFLVVCAWCTLFPFLRREAFENSPIAWRIHGIPVLTILAVLATAFIIPIMYRLTKDTTFSVNPAVGVWGAVIVITAGLAWFYGWRTYQIHHGIDLDRRYTQIPVEYLLPDSEIRQRHQAEAALRRAHDELERRVRERTAELAQANEILTEEIRQRQDAEKTRSRLEDQLRQAQKMEAIGRLAGGLAHDFNNILTVITGYSDLLLDRLAPNDPSRAEIEEIRQASEQAARLTAQLLAFSRRQILQPRALNVNEVVSTMETMLRHLIGEDIQLITLLSPDLAPVTADRSQLEQIIINLALNARDAMPHGGTLTLHTRNTHLDPDYARQAIDVRPGPYAVLRVADAGTGMDPDIRARIFEPFFTTKSPGHGTGLGLATVFGIVKQGRGHISVTSEPGQGSTFEIYLPQSGDPIDHYPTQADQPPTALSGTETVLLVEDDPAVRRLTLRFLRQYGYHVLEAANGRDALHLCQQYQDAIHVVITDVVMPHMGGRELATRLARLRPNTAVLFMSGHTDSTPTREWLPATSIALLQKPFTANALARRIRELLAPPEPR